MANELSISWLNPLQPYGIDNTNPVYNTKLWTDYPYGETIKDWEERRLYCGKWQTNDTIRLQFESNFDPIQVDLFNEDGVSLLTVVANQKLANKYEPGKYVYEAEMSLASLPPGHYQPILNAGGGLHYEYFQPIDIAVIHPRTKLFEYSNTHYHGDVIFETGIVFSFRVEADFGKLLTGSNDTIYDDQKENPFLLRSIATRAYPLVIGGEFGVPEWVDDKQNQIWTCNSVFIDGKSYAKSSDGKAEIKTEDDYPLYAITRNIREGINRGSKIIRPEGDPGKKLIVGFNLDTGVFGDVGESGSTNIITILSRE